MIQHVAPTIAADVEAAYIGLDDDQLYIAVVTGFPESGLDGWGGHYWEHYDPGDLALDVTGDGVYDYAVDVSAGGLLRAGNLVWEDPAIDGHPAWGGAADPLRVTSWDQTKNVDGYRYGAFDGRYAVEAIIGLEDLGPMGGSVKLHWTMGCGNDVADLVHPVPEPTGLLLLGGGLAMVGLLNGKRRKKSLKSDS